MKDHVALYTFGWDLCYTCNYRCPYCGVWERKNNGNPALDANQWLNVWNKIFDKYGSCRIYMSGGEPSTYPYFYDLVRELTNKHIVDICTNLSWDVDKIIPEIPGEKLKISATFHPSFADFNIFFAKAVKIKAYLSNSQIFYVAYPGQIREMPERALKFKMQRINLIPLPLRGNQIVLNNEEEKKAIRKISPYRGEKKDYQLQDISPFGRLCHAGHYYGVIRANGVVDRCGQYENGSLGNVFDNNFELFKEPLPCEKNYCPIESQWIVQ